MTGSRICAILLLTVSLATPVRAQEIWLHQDVDCGSWIQARESRNAEAAAWEFLVVGMLNGMSMGSAEDFWKATGLDISDDQAFLWVDKYCRENPLNSVILAVIGLFRERTGWTGTRRQ